MKAVAAMSLNRVIGRGNQIPWHLPEDFRWFKQLTTGHVVLMGHKTFDSLGKPLPNRTNLVATRRRAENIPGVTCIHDLDSFDEAAYAPRTVFVIGGAQIYAQLLGRCTDLFLTIVQREVEGDAFFPAFEDRWHLHDIPLRTADFEVRHYRPQPVAASLDGEGKR